MEQKMSDSVAEKKDKGIDAVLYTWQQRKTSKAHEEQLKQEGKNAKQHLCKDISSITSLNVDELSSLHLIVDTCLYGILMSGGRLCEVAFKKFTELDESGKTIYVLDTFGKEFNNLYYQIPENARELWVHSKRQIDIGSSHHHDGLPSMRKFSEAEIHVEGVSGGTIETANTSGYVEGGMGNKTTGDVAVNSGHMGTSRDTFKGSQINFYFGKTEEIEVGYRHIRDQDSSSIRVEQGSATSPHNETVITINNAEKEVEIADEVKNNKDKLLSKVVRKVEVGTGSVIIKLIVDKNHKMTDKWLQTILKTIFYDILGNFFTEGTTFQVTVERQVCLGEEGLLNLYAFRQSHRDCVPKTKFEAMKSQYEARAMHGESSSSLEGCLNMLNVKSETLDDDATLKQKPLEVEGINTNSLEISLQEKQPLENGQESSLTFSTFWNIFKTYPDFEDEGISLFTVEEGLQSSLQNVLKVTINNSKQQGKAVFDKLIMEKQTLKRGPVHEVETDVGSGIIKLTVDKAQKMTTKWIQEILRKMFHDIFPEETKFLISVERNISVGAKEFLGLYFDDQRDAESKKTADDDQFTAVTADSGIASNDDLHDDGYFDLADSMMSTTQRRYKESKMSVSGYDITGCSKCESIVGNTDELPISETRYLVTHMTASTLTSWRPREVRSRLRWKLKCLVSALQNTGGGVVLIHIDGLEPTNDYLGFFHEFADNVLSVIMEDGSLYVNSFRIEWMKKYVQDNDENPHDLYSNVVFIGVSPSNSLITVNFNSPVGTDCRLLHPTSEQTRRYLKMKKTFPNTVPCVRGLQNLQESRNVQCRRYVFSEAQRRLLHDDLLLADFIWKKFKLEYCVSAFSKVEGGGSFYLGVCEMAEKLPSYITRKYHIEGCQLNSQRRDGLMAALRQKIETETLVLFFDSEQSPAPLPQEYVEMVFHEVSNKFVLEVAVAAVNGLVFHTKEGPEAYKLDEENHLQRLDLQEWRRRLLEKKVDSTSTESLSQSEFQDT